LINAYHEIEIHLGAYLQLYGLPGFYLHQSNDNGQANSIRVDGEAFEEFEDSVRFSLRNVIENRIQNGRVIQMITPHFVPSGNRVAELRELAGMLEVVQSIQISLYELTFEHFNELIVH
jgi:hypothetical protein